MKKVLENAKKRKLFCQEYKLYCKLQGKDLKHCHCRYYLLCKYPGSGKWNTLITKNKKIWKCEKFVPVDSAHFKQYQEKHFQCVYTIK